MLVGLFTLHIVLVFVPQAHPVPGPGRTNKNVVGYPFMPVYIAKAGGFFFIVFGVIALVAAVVTINPIWAYGPYDPAPSPPAPSRTGTWASPTERSACSRLVSSSPGVASPGA